MRLSESDHMKIKRIAKRLGVRDSDIFRFAIKTTLAKLSPLDRYDRTGKEVISAFIQSGKELANFFSFDADTLEAIINNGSTPEENHIELRDIELIAMSALPDHYLQSKINELVDAEIANTGIDNALREYLYKKYLCQNETAEV